MIVEDISSIIDPRLSQVVLGRPFVEISNMTHNPPEGVVRFTNRTDEVAYKMPHKIEQYNSLSDLEKEHKKLVYLRNDEDKRRGVEYMMSKILGFYKECLKLGHEYVTGMDDEGEVTGMSRHLQEYIQWNSILRRKAGVLVLEKARLYGAVNRGSIICISIRLLCPTIAISCNLVHHSRTKHIVVRYHFIKEHVEKGTIEMYFVKTDYQLADLFTKALPVDRFNYLVRRLGMRSLSPRELERLAKS
ncbi:hypothetical protein Tco_0255836 [Tanacetum coccineum]